MSGLFPPARLYGMNEDCVRIGWTRGLGEVQRMTDRAPMVGPVVDEMKESLFSGQRTVLAVDKLKADCLRMLARRKRFSVGLQPDI